MAFKEVHPGWNRNRCREPFPAEVHLSEVLVEYSHGVVALKLKLSSAVPAMNTARQPK